MKRHHITSAVTAAIIAIASQAWAQPSATKPAAPAEIGIPVPNQPEGEYAKDSRVPATIKWTAVEQTIKATAQDDSVSFRFEGTATEAITIPYVQFSCGCQNGRLNAKSFKAGEKVILTGKMSFSPGSGKYQRALMVYTNKGGPTTLNVTADAPKLIDFSARSLTWEVGDKSEKELVVTTMDNNLVQDIQVLGGGFTQTTTKEGNGKINHIKVTPDGTNPRGALRITEKTNSRPSYITLVYGPSKTENVAPTPTAPTAPTPPTSTSPPASQPASQPVYPGTLPTQPQRTGGNSSDQKLRKELELARDLINNALNELDSRK